MTDAQVVALAAQLGASVFGPEVQARLESIAAALRQFDLVSAYVDRVNAMPRL